MRIVLKIFEIQRGRIILFSKGCPSPLFAPLFAVVAATPAQATGLAVGGLLAAASLQAHRGQPPPCRRTAGSRPLRPGRGRQALAGLPLAAA
ncbi:hypothetical protein GW17_00058801, partial [Ensete ventricosum]